jgi:ATP-binding cassette subfamily B protein
MADRILVLNNGELIEAGSHEELLAKNGRYSELFNLQAMGYR